jgi:alkaline phosphatase
MSTFNWNTALPLLLVFAMAVFAFAETAPETKPKNIIIMVGDGMGFNQVNAASLYFNGRINSFAWQQIDQQLAMSTYHSNCSYDDRLAWSDFDYAHYQATDSAASATAMSTGRKTYNSAIGTSGNSDLENVMERAQAAGKKTGVVSTVPFTHATPAAFSVHNQSRYNYEEIARAMYASGLDVIMGCGHPEYGRGGEPVLFNRKYRYVGGRQSWEAVRSGQYGYFIEKRSDFLRLAEGKTPKRVIGIPRVARTLQQERPVSDPYGEERPYRDPFITTVPTLAEMTMAALNVVDDDPDGFVIMIEGGAIDWAAHDNQKDRLIEEVAGFDEAVGAVLRWVNANSNWNETLLIVTADHETGYLTVSKGASMANPLIGRGLQQLPQMHFNSAHHTNHLVPFYAHGAGSEQFRAAADESDAARGWYLDNAEMGSIVLGLIH